MPCLVCGTRDYPPPPPMGQPNARATRLAQAGDFCSVDCFETFKRRKQGVRNAERRRAMRGEL